MRSEHKPLPIGAIICIICNQPAINHRVAHTSIGDPCSCGLPASNHRMKSAEERANENATFRTEGKKIEQVVTKGIKRAELRGGQYKPHGLRKLEKQQRVDEGLSNVYLGIDGEGQGREVHSYVYLAAATADGRKSYSVESVSWRDSWNPNFVHPDGVLGGYDKPVQTLPTTACMDFLLMLPTKARKFSFACNYDITKWLEDVDNKAIYELFRPKLRKTLKRGSKFKRDTKPVKILNKKYEIDLTGTKFTVAEIGYRLTRRKTVLWDIFKFYGSKFVTALIDWKVGVAELHERMTKMKDKRGEFDKESPDDVSAYCLEECVCMAQLAEKLDAAHNKAGIPLKKIGYYGAGSSATAMLKVMGILDKIRLLPEAMHKAIAMSFFGGRFENAYIGEIYNPVFNRDISSAYPYQIMFLPCLVHGAWRHTRRRSDIDGKIALIHYSLDHQHSNLSQICKTWGPFPFRIPEGKQKGSICFPATSGGGWVFQDEYFAGERLFPHVGFREAWVHDSDCACQPFERISHYYLYRLLIGKEGPGIAIKLAVNSCYGKLAQSIGSAKFNCWLWAAYITSGCRGQLLSLMGMAPSLDNILMVATDGIAANCYLPHPTPKDTGTNFLLHPDTLKPDSSLINEKPLGGWEAPQEKHCLKCDHILVKEEKICLSHPDDKAQSREKVNRRGLFLGRPGIYFPIDPSKDDMKEIKARGLGRGVLLDNYGHIIKSWREKGPVDVKVANVSRFCGAKTSISRSGKPRHYEYKRAEGGMRKNAHGEMAQAPKYGGWVTREVKMSFDPQPKRDGIAKDGKSLIMRYMPHDLESLPYKRAVAMQSPEAKELRAIQRIANEQPDMEQLDLGDEILFNEIL